MNYEEFKQDVTDRIKDFLPDKYADADVSIQQVVKNNDMKLDGLLIRLEESNIAPNIYLNQFFDQHENGRDMDDILANIADVRTQHEVSHDFDVNKLTDFDSVKDRITCRLVNAEQNADYLADKPHTIMDDLAVTYHIAIGKEESGTMSAPITNRLMEGYGVDVEQLHKLALDNMDTLTPATFKSMTETMVDMMLPDMMRDGMTEEEARGVIAAMLPPAQDEVMYVLSNEDKLNGAAMLLNDKVMDDISEKLGKDFYILPSSVHEVLIVPKTQETDLEALENMVQEVNATQVAPEERLSDHVYAYDAKEHELFRADKAEERVAEKAQNIEETVSKNDDRIMSVDIHDDMKDLADKIDAFAENKWGTFYISVTDGEKEIDNIKILDLNMNERLSDNSIKPVYDAGGRINGMSSTDIADTISAYQERGQLEERLTFPDSTPNSHNELKNSPKEQSPVHDGSSQLTVSISSKLVSDPFTAKDGKEYVRVQIPNEDRNDKSPWASIVVTPEQVKRNEETGRAEISLKSDGHSTLVKSEYKGKDENGKGIYEHNQKKVSNVELKKRVERTEPKNIGNALKANKEKAAEINKQREKSSEHNKSVNRNNGRE